MLVPGTSFWLAGSIADQSVSASREQMGPTGQSQYRVKGCWIPNPLVFFSFFISFWDIQARSKAKP
jgi:hypothetical protein